MLAILFTNVAFTLYLVYLVAERKWNCYKTSRFWLAVAGLLASLFIAFYYLYLPEDVGTAMYEL